MAECLLGRLKERAVLPGAAESCPVPVHLAKLGDGGEGALLCTHVCQERNCMVGSAGGFHTKSGFHTIRKLSISLQFA